MAWHWVAKATVKRETGVVKAPETKGIIPKGKELEKPKSLVDTQPIQTWDMLQIAEIREGWTQPRYEQLYTVGETVSSLNLTNLIASENKTLFGRIKQNPEHLQQGSANFSVTCQTVCILGLWAIWTLLQLFDTVIVAWRQPKRTSGQIGVTVVQ